MQMRKIKLFNLKYLLIICLFDSSKKKHVSWLMHTKTRTLDAFNEI